MAGRLAAAHGARAFVVGGLVRDALLERSPAAHDLDVVVEGDALAVARALADAVGGVLVEHERFLTASVTLADRKRVDLVTARSERYERPGALPHVLPALIAQDLKRRDFTVNTLAVELASGGFGLLDPLGGGADLARRKLRILHPLSFVEDPTRIFRAARYAARLGFALDPWSARCPGAGAGAHAVPRAVTGPDRGRTGAHPRRRRARPGAHGAGAGRGLPAARRSIPDHARRPRATPDGAGDARVDARPRHTGAAAGTAGRRARRRPDGGDRRRHAAGARPERRAAGARASDADRRRGAEEQSARPPGGATRPGRSARRARPRRPGCTSAETRQPANGWTGSRQRCTPSGRRSAAATPSRWGCHRGRKSRRCWPGVRDGRLEGKFATGQGEIDYVKAWVQNRKKEG